MKASEYATFYFSIGKLISSGSMDWDDVTMTG